MRTGLRSPCSPLTSPGYHSVSQIAHDYGKTGLKLSSTESRIGEQLFGTSRKKRQLLLSKWLCLEVSPSSLLFANRKRIWLAAAMTPPDTGPLATCTGDPQDRTISLTQHWGYREPNTGAIVNPFWELSTYPWHRSADAPEMLSR